MAYKKQQGKFLKENVQKKPTSPQSASKKSAKNTGKPNTVVLVFAALAICVALVASVFFISNLGLKIKLPGRTIASGVEIAGVDVGGLRKNEAIETLTTAIGDAYSTEPMLVTVLDKQLEIAPAVSGASLDVETVVDLAFEYGTKENPATEVDILPCLNLNTGAIQKKIQEFAVDFPTEGIDGSYEIIKETVEEKETTVLSITLGSVYYDFDADALYDAILNGYNNCSFQVSYNCNQIIGESVDLDSIYAENSKEAVDAYWDKETHEVVPSEIGYRFDLDGAKEAVSLAKPGDVLEFPFEELLPEIDTAAIEALLFRDELGTYTAKSGSSYNRDTNLRLACEALDGTILYPGDVFSYNEALGERTAEKGYKPADSYLGDQTVQTYGGGICQPSSCLYYCTLLADLEIVQRSNHGFISSYMPYGMDATVDWKGPDFKFSNNTNYPIRIDAKADGGSVTITLVGTDEKDYYIEMEYEVWGTTAWTEKEAETDDKDKDGKTKISPYTGYTVQTYKVKYNKETDEQISREKEAYSVYAKRDKVVYKYKGEETEPTTEPTAPPATNPPATDPTTVPTEAPTTPPTEAPTTPPTEAPTVPPAPDPLPENGGGIGEATG